MQKHEGSSKHLIFTCLLLLVMLSVFNPPVSYGVEKHGMLFSDFMRYIGIILVIVNIIGLIFVEFFYNRLLHRGTYHMLLLGGLFAIPTIALMSTTSVVLEETKKISACGSCHVMDPFINDMSDPDSPTLAARHYKNKWIADKQCYSCHTTYGAHGTIEGKRDGFRHWLLYVTHTWHDPIQFSGSYPNSACLDCHRGTNKFERVKSHHALLPELAADRMNCTTCHGPPHPVPSERGNYARTGK
jgi:cytochrome c nitrite reductase small subunit